MSNISATEKSIRIEQTSANGTIYESEIECAPVIDHFHDAAEMREVLEMLRASPIYKRLAAVPASGEGNLLEPNGLPSSDETSIRKLMVLERIFRGIRPGTILETGTNKGFFGLAAHTLCPSFLCELDTFDIHPGGQKAAAILDEFMYTRFTLGDSRETLPKWNQFAELAWIDGGHWDGVAKSDIEQAMRLKIPCIVVDDMDMDAVHADFDAAVEGNPDYTAQSFHDTWPIGVLLRGVQLQEAQSTTLLTTI